jgi:hypothetical protein
MLDITHEDIAFTAIVDELVDRDGKAVPREMARGVYREDTGQLLSVCGNRYAPIQHMDIIDPVLQTLKDGDYEIQERPYGKHDLYDLKGQKGAFVSYETSDYGAKMRANIIVGDFITPTGNTQYLEDGPATMFREYAVLNSHDMSLAARLDPGYKVLACMNGARSTQFSASVRTKHTSGFNVEAFKRQILASAELMANDLPRFEAYAKTKCTVDQAESFLKKTFCKLPDRANGDPHWSQPLLERILKRFKDVEPQTVWGVYMALTWYATHGDMKASSNPLTTSISRDEQVVRTMRSPEMESLLGWSMAST